MELVPDVPSSTWLIRYDAKHYLVILKQAHVSVDCEILNIFLESSISSRWYAWRRSVVENLYPPVKPGKDVFNAR